MEPYIVSARKYRPATFASVVGQKSLTETLKNAIATGRLSHSYLFCGSRGVGKTSCARIFAKTINCTNRTPEGEACNECDSCRAFNEGSSMNILEMDAASNNGVENIRDITEQVQIPPTRGRYRVFIIDEVHMLSSAAFNAFLKTLEEPPSYVIFILATTEKQKIIPTILSRCQIYDFNRITVRDMVEHLQYVASQEGIQAEPGALNVIARQADGAMRDALSIFDQVAASSRGNITYESTLANLNVLDRGSYSGVLDACIRQDIPSALSQFHDIRRRGFDPQVFINGLADYLRDLMLASSGATAALVDAPEDVRAALAEEARRLKPEFIYAAAGLCNDCDLNYRQATNKVLLAELTLIRIAQLLNPSPAKSDLGEGSLKPIERPEAAEVTAAPAPAPQPTKTPDPAKAPNPGTAAPAPAPHRRPAAPGAPALRVGGLSIGGQRPREAEKAHVRERPYDESNVAAAWMGFIAANPDRQLLINAMRTAMPQKLPSGKYGISVTSAVQGRMIEEVMDEIIEFIRAKVDNDAFDLVMEVHDSGPSPEFWNDRQVLEHIVENYPGFSEFVADLKLTLL